MNFVFISPNFPTAYERFCEGLHDNGVNVLGIGDASYDSLSDRLKNALTEYYRVEDMRNYDQMIRAMGYFTGQYGKIDWVESNNEYWMELDAALRTDFNITTGLKSDQIMRYRSKTAMKKYYKKAGVPAARYSQVVDLETAKHFIDEVGYPVIVKPDRGVGALATWRLENDDDLREFFHQIPELPYVMEEYITGVVETYDGVINRFTALFGLAPVKWLSNPGTALYVLIGLGVWQFGSSMLIFLAALKNGPASYHEAAIVDGAGPVRRFFKIVFPMITPIFFFNLINQTIGAFQAFNSSYLITQGKPLNTTLYYGVHLYNRAFTYYEMGYGSAMAWFMLLVIAIFTALIFRSSSAWVYYESEGK